MLISAAVEPENALAVPPPQPAAMPNDRSAIGVEPAPVGKTPEAAAAPAAPPDDGVPPPDDGVPVAVGRDAVLAAFKRNRAPPSPQPASPQPRPAVRQVERPPERQAEPISREGWEELVSGYVAGNVNWNVKRLGAPPGDPNCRAPRDLLRSFGL